MLRPRRSSFDRLRTNGAGTRSIRTGFDCAVRPERRAATQSKDERRARYYSANYTRERLASWLTYGSPRECIEGLRSFRGSGARRIALRISTANSESEQFDRQPVRILVGFAAGGGTDTAARMVAQKLTESLGQPVVVENRAGSGGIIATEAVAKSSRT